MKLTPMPGMVFIEYVEQGEERSSGIVLPTSMVKREEQRTGRIVAVGKGDGSTPVNLQVGQYALFKKHSADVFTIASRLFFAVQEEDILAVIDDAKTFESLKPVDV